MIIHLDLFSGIGGFALAAQMVGGIVTRQFVEIDPFCQKVLAKNFKGVPIHDNVETFTARPGTFDIITAGFPCQDISVANPKGRGLEGERSGLFYEVIRILRQCRPHYLVLENSPALLTSRNGRDMGTILWELSQCGYDAEWQIVSAASVGAQHLRKRLFIVASANASSLRLARGRKQSTQRKNPKNGKESTIQIQGLVPDTFRESDPLNVRSRSRIPHRVDRIKALGNSVVPAAAAIPLLRVKALSQA